MDDHFCGQLREGDITYSYLLSETWGKMECQGRCLVMLLLFLNSFGSVLFVCCWCVVFVFGFWCCFLGDKWAFCQKVFAKAPGLTRGVPNSKHYFTTSFLGGRCRKAMLGVCPCTRHFDCNIAYQEEQQNDNSTPALTTHCIRVVDQTPSTGFRHHSLEEGAGKRCSECGRGHVFVLIKNGCTRAKDGKTPALTP